MHTRMRHHHLIGLLFLLLAGTAQAAVTSGYYRIKSNHYAGRYIGENASHRLITATDISQTDYSFVWYLTVNGSNVTIKNAATQRTVQRLDSTSGQYSTSAMKTDNVFTLAANGNTYTFTDNNNCGLHCAASASYNIVQWYTSADANKWIIEAVTPDATELAAQQAAAQLTVSSGNYRIYSNAYDGKYVAENSSSHTLVTGARSDNNYAQVWFLDINADGEVTIKNVLTDRYVQLQGTNSTQYVTDTGAATFALGETKGDSYNTYSFVNGGGSAGFHCAATQSYNVVYWWDASSVASVWRVEAAEVDADALAAQKAALQTVSADQLTPFFTTTACTELNSSYASMTDEALRSAMSDLPTTVQDMAVKVKNNAWTTYGGWDKTERTFRVADYKAYSSGDRWTGIVGYGHHFGRLSNPTGIYADAGDILQVYVGNVPDGQSVALEVAGYGQASGSVYALNEGMNTLLIAAAGNCFVFYEVDNTTSGAEPYTPIANYAPVTVHIEGGTVQGCMDLTRGFTDTDFAAMATYLFSKETVCLKSTTHVFNLNKTLLVGALPSLAEPKVEEMMAFWTGTAQLEDNLCARADFDTYCNNIYSVTGHAGSGNPNATTYGTNYFEAAYSGLFNADQLKQSSGGLWTIAHEQGHNRQKLIQLIGTTEISNNMFSNAAMDWQGRYTSRTNTLQSSFERWQEGLSWPQRVASGGTWDCLSMYTQLYRYFHQAGYDTDFYPNLFRAFRASPMTLRAGTPVPASEDYLKFYQTCCDVAKLDLTEFFEVYSFFLLPPAQDAQTINGISTGNYYVQIGDYSTYYVYVTQEMIDAAKNAVAAKGYPKCNIMFIEDRITAPLATYEGHAEGEVRKTYEGGSITAGEYGETGQYTDFGQKPGAYVFNVGQRGNVTVSGTGAVGFKLYDTEGKLVGVYNSTTFVLPTAAFDENGLKSGYMLQAAAGDGTNVAMTRDATIAVNEFPKTDVWYSLCTPLRETRYVQNNGAGAGLTGVTLTQGSMPANALQWRFVQREGETETFDIVSRTDGSYINPASAVGGAQLATSASLPSAGWKVATASTDGYYIIYSGTNQLHQANSGNAYKILNWGSGTNRSDDGCQYKFTEVEPIDVPTLSDNPLDELAGWHIRVASQAASDLATGQWYVMFDRGLTSGQHGYLYEKVSTHTLYNTATVPAGAATEAAKYLVRLADAGDGCYYIQTGYGNYFGQIEDRTNVPVIATQTERIAINKIANTDGHFYLQGKTGGVILDANELSHGDATVVGWGTGIPTQTDGNNDWAFYPVELVWPVSLVQVGKASYATFFFDQDMQSDADTKAYYITEVADGSARLTATGNEGHDIPARTAVVLINSIPAATATLTPAEHLEPVVSESANMLKGTLESMQLDLSDNTTYFSMGRKGGQIGFFKFDNGDTTTITLGANKAYLDTSVAVDGNVKGFYLWLGNSDTPTIVRSVTGSSPSTKQPVRYNLAGQRVQNMHKGIYVSGGRKVLVR